MFSPEFVHDDQTLRALRSSVVVLVVVLVGILVGISVGILIGISVFIRCLNDSGSFYVYLGAFFGDSVDRRHLPQILNV